MIVAGVLEAQYYAILGPPRGALVVMVVVVSDIVGVQVATCLVVVRKGAVRRTGTCWKCHRIQYVCVEDLVVQHAQGGNLVAGRIERREQLPHGLINK